MKNLKSVKNNLEALIKKYDLEKDLNAEIVIGWVKEEDEPDAMTANREYQNRWMKYFNSVSDIDEMNTILEVFTDIWNYFPHKSLNNLSPMEMFK